MDHSRVVRLWEGEKKLKAANTSLPYSKGSPISPPQRRVVPGQSPEANEANHPHQFGTAYKLHLQDAGLAKDSDGSLKPIL